ncbi:MAG: hypothetical protein Q9M15_03480 [Mariprofundaceae bacterium]|nr:hypothetical protein [Mariprofundaceae bacterium]
MTFKLTSRYLLERRGLKLGHVSAPKAVDMPDKKTIMKAWKNDQSIVLPKLLDEQLPRYQADIQRAHQCMESTLNGVELGEQLEKNSSIKRLEPEFSFLASSMEEHDEQAIEKLYFDAGDEQNILAEDLWCKASWLSFHDEDASLRFRFSFGMEGYEDVAADPKRQHWAGELCTKMFPESELITKNTDILQYMSSILGHQPAFVERIVYFNTPNGGAQFHHDVERGHAGVVFAQLSGATFWLAANKLQLMQVMRDFSEKHNTPAELQSLLKNQVALSDYMEEEDHGWVESLIDHNPIFIQYMIKQGYAHVLQTGDVLLLPQRDLNHCVWHSVFTLGDEPGEALSFAVR